MKKLPATCYLLLVTLVLLAAPVHATVTINTIENTELIITPIKTTEQFESLGPSAIYFSGEDGIININYSHEEFDLAVKIDGSPPYYAKLREGFSSMENREVSIFPEERGTLKINLPDVEKEDLPNFIVTGYAVYEEKKDLIVPVYYSIIGVLVLILFITLVTKRDSHSNRELIAEADDLLAHDRLERAKDEFVEAKTELTEAKEKIEDVPEIEEESSDPEVKEEVREQEAEVPENEVFKEDEEKLEEEVRKEAKLQESISQSKEGQPAPISDKSSPEELEAEAEELEKKEKS